MTELKSPKAEKILAIVEKCKNILSDEEREFLLHEAELLEKRNAYKNDQPTKKHIENEEIQKKLLAAMKKGKYHTATNLRNTINQTGEISVQRTSALLFQMVHKGLIKINTLKRTTYFYLPSTPPPKKKNANYSLI